MLIEVTSGNENFPTANAKFHTFVVPTRRFPGQEKHIGKVAQDRDPVRRVIRQGSPQIVSAAVGYIDQFGKWTTCRYDVPEGLVLKLFGQRKQGWSTMEVRASLYIRIRAQAALRRVSALLTGWEKAQYNRVNVEGRFDILTADDLPAEGIVVPVPFRRFMEPGMVSRMFETTVLAAEEQAAPVIVQTVVQNSQGEEVAVPTAHRRRRLDL